MHLVGAVREQRLLHEGDTARCRHGDRNLKTVRVGGIRAVGSELSDHRLSVRLRADGGRERDVAASDLERVPTTFAICTGSHRIDAIDLQQWQVRREIGKRGGPLRDVVRAVGIETFDKRQVAFDRPLGCIQLFCRPPILRPERDDREQHGDE